MSKTTNQLTHVVASVKEHFQKMLFAYRNKNEQFEWFDLIRSCCLDARAFDEKISSLEACDKLVPLFEKIAIYSLRAYIDARGGVDDDRFTEQFNDSVKAGLVVFDRYSDSDAWRFMRICSFNDIILETVLRLEDSVKKGERIYGGRYLYLFDYALCALILIEEKIQQIIDDKNSNIQQEI